MTSGNCYFESVACFVHESAAVVRHRVCAKLRELCATENEPFDASLEQSGTWVSDDHWPRVHTAVADVYRCVVVLRAPLSQNEYVFVAYGAPQLSDSMPLLHLGSRLPLELAAGAILIDSDRHTHFAAWSVG
jgi:hypothetical protein